jgi:hypothetical protein
LGPDKDEIDTLVKRLGKTFKIEDQGELSDYLGIKKEIKPDGILEWTQPTLIQLILKDLKLDGEEVKRRQNKPNVKAVPANTAVPVTDHKDSLDHNPKDFEYRHIIWKLLYLEKSTRPDIMCSTPMCQALCNPKIKKCTAAVKRYLLGPKIKV